MKWHAVKLLSFAIVGRGEGASCHGNGEMIGNVELLGSVGLLGFVELLVLKGDAVGRGEGA